MDPTATAIVKDGAQSHTLRFDACRVFLGGEFAGNIEVDVACSAEAASRLVDGLRVQLPGEPASGMALGSGHYASGIQLVFWTDAATRLRRLPEQLTLLWSETPVATIAPILKDSVAIESKVEFTEPTAILTQPPIVTASSQVRLAANREKAWYLLSALLVAAGVLVALAVPGLELPSLVLKRAVGGALGVAGLAVGLQLAHVPYRQVWLDRDRRRVLVIGGRTRRPESKLADAPGRSLDDFDHVRVYMRWQLRQGVDEHDQEIWRVTLEGPIPFASEDGTVHLDDEALLVGEYASDLTARRVAAEIAYHTGLKILDTGHDETA